MKKSILALALIGALSMLGACSSDNDDNGGNTVSGNFAKEPIKGAKLELKNLGDIEAGKIAEATTDATGKFTFNFAGVPGGANAYVVSIAKDGLKDAVLLNKANGGTKWADVTDPDIKGVITDDAAIILSPNHSGQAQFNPIGIAATEAVKKELNIKKLDGTEEVNVEKAIEAAVSVEGKVETIAANLAIASGLAENLVNVNTILNGAWSPNLEYVLQVVKKANVDINTLVNKDVDLNSKTADLISVSQAAKDVANAAAEEVAKQTGTKVEVVTKENPKKQIIRSYLFSKDQPNVLIPSVVNATNGSKHYLNGTIRGADLATELRIAKGEIKPQDLDQATNATRVVGTSKITGITIDDKKSKNEFSVKIDVANATNGSVIFASTFSAPLDNAKENNHKEPIFINIGEFTNSSVLSSISAPCGWGTDNIAFGFAVEDDGISPELVAGAHVCTKPDVAPCGYYSDNSPRHFEREGDSVYCIAEPATNPNP